MKSLSCKQCGGSDFVEEGDLYVCMNCYSKYSKYDSSIFHNVEINMKDFKSEKIKFFLNLADSDYKNGLFSSAKTHYTSVLEYDAHQPVAYYRRILCMCYENFSNFVNVNHINYGNDSIKYFEKSTDDKQSIFQFRNAVAEDYLNLSASCYKNAINKSSEGTYNLNDFDFYSKVFSQSYNSLVFAKSTIDYSTTFLNKKARERYMDICLSIQAITKRLSNEYLLHMKFNDNPNIPGNYIYKKIYYDPQGFYKKAYENISIEIENIPKKVEAAKRYIMEENAKKFRANPELRQKRLNQLYEQKSKSIGEIEKAKGIENALNLNLENYREEIKNYTFSFFGEGAKIKRELRENINST